MNVLISFLTFFTRAAAVNQKNKQSSSNKAAEKMYMLQSIDTPKKSRNPIKTRNVRGQLLFHKRLHSPVAADIDSKASVLMRIDVHNPSADTADNKIAKKHPMPRTTADKHQYIPESRGQPRTNRGQSFYTKKSLSNDPSMCRDLETVFLVEP